MDEEKEDMMDTKNTPLTPEELRGMDGQPVWCVTGDGRGGFWGLVDADGAEFCAVDKDCGMLPEYFYNMSGIGAHGLHLLGRLAFRRPPEVA